MKLRHFHKYGLLFLLSLFISVKESTAKLEALQVFSRAESLQPFQSAEKGSMIKGEVSLIGDRSAKHDASSSIENVSAVTVVDTYLNIPNGDIVAGINPIAASQKHKKQKSVTNVFIPRMS